LLSPAAGPTCADATRLPFADGGFDLVFCQLALLWMPLEATVAEIRRVLQPGGVLVAIEPDYGGMIEYPPKIATRDLWIAALQRAGADPYVGRKLPGLLARHGFAVSVELMSSMTPPASERFDLLQDLSLTDAERETLRVIQRRASGLSGSWEQIAHLPFMLVSASLSSGTARRAWSLRWLLGRSDSG
jgi:SAM-dependent methyltransferase